jgi:molybdate transport system permease protein
MLGIDPWQAIWLSIQVGLWCAVLGLPFGIIFGWILARCDFPGKSLFNMLIFAPLVVPPVVTGYLLLSVVGRASPLGHFFEAIGFSFSFSFAGAVLASFIVGMPFYIMAIRSAFEAVDPKLEEMALTLGLPPMSVFFRVTLPLAFPGIGAGALLAFARALGEFGATVVLAGNMEGKTRTIALAVYSLLETPNGMGASRILVVASLLISLLALFGYEMLLRWNRSRLEWRHEK